MYQRGSHNKKLACDLEIEFLHHLDILKVAARDKGDRDIIDIDLVFPDEMQQEVERAFKRGELYFVQFIHLQKTFSVRIFYQIHLKNNPFALK